jgi:hypothetical protein
VLPRETPPLPQSEHPSTRLRPTYNAPSTSSMSRSPKNALRIWNGKRASQLTMRSPPLSKRSLRSSMRLMPGRLLSKRNELPLHSGPEGSGRSR